MSATFTKGYTFASGGTCNAANLHTLLESATLASVTRDNVDRTTAGQACCPFTFSSSAPSAPVALELWQNSLSMVILAWNATNSRWEATNTNHERWLVASTSSAITAAYALKAMPLYEVALADGGLDDENVVGIAAHDASASGQVVIVRHGICRAKVTGTVNAGDGLQLSATAGQLQSSDGPFNQGAGLVARALTTKDVSGYSWVILKR